MDDASQFITITYDPGPIRPRAPNALSIIMPTHRIGLSVWARIIKAYGWASEDVQVIVRDNSGDPAKRKLLASLQRPNLIVRSVEPCSGAENFSEAFKLATGEFVLMVADDDEWFERGIHAIGQAARSMANETIVSGITGAYILEQTMGSGIIEYANLNSDDPMTRLISYMGLQGPNALYYSAVRRNHMAEVIDIQSSYPFMFSFRDQLAVLHWLMAGSFIHVGRLVCSIENGNWENHESAVRTDLNHLDGDPILRQFHWLFCAHEGVRIVMDKTRGDMLDISRLGAASQWYHTMFNRFASEDVEAYDSVHADAVRPIRKRLLKLTSASQIDKVLDELCKVIALFSPEKATAYRDVWKAVGEKRRVVA